MRPKWDPEKHPRRHSWEVYEVESPWGEEVMGDGGRGAAVGV